jgi:hypothetical protein
MCNSNNWNFNRCIVVSLLWTDLLYASCTLHYTRLQNENHSDQKNGYFIYITPFQHTPHWIAENDLPPSHKTCMNEWHNLEN